MIEIRQYESNMTLGANIILRTTAHIGAIHMVNEYIRRAIEIINKDLTAELLAILRNGADKTINLFFVSIFSGIIVCSVIGITLYKSLW